MSASEFVYTVLLKPRPLRVAVNTLLKMCVPDTLDVMGARIKLNRKDPVLSGALTLGVYEKDEIRFFRNRLEPTMTFFDIGANVGLYTGLALASEGFRGTIVSFEPNEESRACLEQTILLNSPKSPESGHPATVRALPFAASDTNETAMLYKNSDNKADNRLYPDPLLSEQEQIETRTIDSLCDEYGISAIDFIKIDVQGWEWKVVKGATKTLSQSPDCILMTEFWPYGLHQCGSTPESYVEALRSCGFSLYELTRRGLSALDEPALIGRTTGRKYANIVGFKGRYGV